MIQKFSNWSFKSEITIERIEDRLRCFPKELDYNNEGIYVENLEFKTLDLEGESIKYLTGIISFQRFKRGYKHKPVNEQIELISEEFIIYDNTKEKLLIILGSKTSSQKLVKNVFQPNFGEINERNVIDKDILYWIVYRLRLYPNKEVLQNSGLYFRGLEGYMGTSSDKTNLVRGQGLRVIALMGTLSFIFNDENLKALKPVIQYKRTKITIEFSSTNTNRVSIDESAGNNIEQQLLVSHKILPKILEAYENDKNSKEWSLESKLTFLQEIGATIPEKVDEQRERIKDELRELNKNINEDNEDNEDNDFEFESQFAIDCLENNPCDD